MKKKIIYKFFIFFNFLNAESQKSITFYIGGLEIKNGVTEIVNNPIKNELEKNSLKDSEIKNKKKLKKNYLNFNSIIKNKRFLFLFFTIFSCYLFYQKINYLKNKFNLFFLKKIKNFL